MIVGLKWPPETTPNANIRAISVPDMAMDEDRGELPFWRPDPLCHVR